MTRRDLLAGACASLSLQQLASAAPDTAVLPGTQPLTWDGDLSVRMMDGAHRFIERKIAAAPGVRGQYWSRNVSSRAAYEGSIEPNRSRFRKLIGVVDPRVNPNLERFGDQDDSALVAETAHYRVFQVRWPVLAGAYGELVFGEGLLLEPVAAITGHIVAIPDADQTPEEIAGLTARLPRETRFAQTLADNGFVVLIPTLLDRTSRWSGHPDINNKVTGQSHREWIYRQAFHMGRHVIGYEVQKVLAAVDWFGRRDRNAHTGVAGYGEGGLIALYAAAADPRIDAALVSGYFDSRQAVSAEPIYRNVWGLLREFGDAEIASLTAPRGLVVEYRDTPQVTGKDAVNQKGALETPPFERVKAEFDRIDGLVARDFQPRELIRSTPGSIDALRKFAGQLGLARDLVLSDEIVADGRRAFSAADRQRRQVLALEAHVQGLVRGSAKTREQFYLYKVEPELADDTWNTDARRPTLSPAHFIEASKTYRDYLYTEVLGRLDDPPLPPNAKTRRIYTHEKWTGYEVVLDVFPDVFAWGILLVPNGLGPGERRPVVVCQHGRNGVPAETVEGDSHYYHDFAARLAERGFVTFSPHNLYRGEDHYRYLSRKANGLKASLFSFLLAQHAQLLRWLGTLNFVDPARIGFYGLSYGGESAVRLPAVLEGYALSICSGDFNSWTEKVAATDLRFGYMYSIEWEMPYFDMGSTFDYAEMTYLILPRPFMVERGHDDRVSRDEWVAHEYAKVRWLYAKFGLENRTEFEYFNGGHTIHAEGTFAFLEKYLKSPRR